MVSRIPAALFMAGGIAAIASAEPTFNKDVLPILQNRCQGCHRPGEAAPMSFLTYKDTRPWAAAIREAVSTREMPPWHADAAHGTFRNERRLTDAEIETLSQWAKTGAKEGDPKDAPAPRQFAEGWTIGKPDLVLDMGADYKVPASGTIEYTYFVAPTGLTEDKWIEKIELRPGARTVVHHAVLLSRPPDSKFVREAKPGVGFVPEPEKETKQENDPSPGEFFSLAGTEEVMSIYVPGGDAYQVRPGQARLLKAGNDLVFQMHYTASGKETTDRTQVGIVFAKQPPKERVINTGVLNTGLKIPPGAPSHRETAKVELQADVKLESMFPHMHLRGKAFEIIAKMPGGEPRTLLKVPRYNFNWQTSYYLTEPLTLPKGTELTAVAWFDNSPNNPFNPDPAKEVHWGSQSWEEMLIGFVDFAIPVDLDPAEIAKGKPAPTSGGE
jgi:hypothetical protein